MFTEISKPSIAISSLVSGLQPPLPPPCISLFDFSSNCLSYFKPKLSKSKLMFFPSTLAASPT